MAFELGLLGDVEARLDGQLVDIGPARQRCVLVALAVDANRPVSVERLADRIWGERAPFSARGTLSSYVTRLRHALSAAPDVSLVRRSGGYVLTVDADAVDLHRFRSLLTEARASHHDIRAEELLEQAIGLWRGEAFAGLDTPWLTSVRDTLHKERHAAELDRTDLQLHRGQHSALLATLSTQAADQPFDERIAAQLMLALAGSGQQAAALRIFSDLRQRLADELGVEPGPELKATHLRVLRQGVAPTTSSAERPRLRGDATPADGQGSVPRDSRRPTFNHLPRDIVDFTGRAEELDRLISCSDQTGATSSVAIHAIDGMAGIGKTTLAIHTAHRLAGSYPDAQLYIDLHAHDAVREPTHPAVALEVLLRSIGVQGEYMPDGVEARAALWRAELADRKALLLLDNAASAAQVRPLLPGNPHCLVLVTSRARLTDLEATRPLAIDVLPPDDATALLTTVIGDARPGHEPDAVRDLVELCGRLPLAIRIAGARLRARPAWTIAYLADRMRARHGSLAELATGDSRVASAFNLSYRQLTARQQHMFRMIGLVTGGDFDVFAAAALTERDTFEAERLLEHLVDIHLVRQTAQGRYTMHDLLRRYARELAHSTESEPDRREAVGRMLDYYLHVTDLADQRLRSRDPADGLGVAKPPAHIPDVDGHAQALSWLEAERANLVTVTGYATEHGWPNHALQLAQVLSYFVHVRGYNCDWITTYQLALTAASRLGDQHARAMALWNLAWACCQLGRYADALDHGNQALLLHRELDRPDEAAAAHLITGHVCAKLGRLPEALEHCLRALEIRRLIDDRPGGAEVLTKTASVLGGMARYDEAAEHCHRALATFRELGLHAAEGVALSVLGEIARQAGRIEEASEHQHRALALLRGAGDRCSECRVLNELGAIYRQTGRLHQALQHHRHALTLADQAHDRDGAARAHEGIAQTYDELAQVDRAESHWHLALVNYEAMATPDAERVRGRLRG